LQVFWLNQRTGATGSNLRPSVLETCPQAEPLAPGFEFGGSRTCVNSSDTAIHENRSSRSRTYPRLLALKRPACPVPAGTQPEHPTRSHPSAAREGEERKAALRALLTT